MADKWIRVTHSHPCPICGKPDWCSIATDIIYCMRVESRRPSKAGGWFHDLNPEQKVKFRERPKPEKIPPLTNASALMRQWDAEPEAGEKLLELAENLGVSWESLAAIGCTYSIGHGAYAFAMRDATDNVIGIRLRDIEGRKWAVRGSKSGIFYARKMGAKGKVYVVEGPTDTAAALDLGVYAIGRPSCLGCESMVNDLIIGLKVRAAVIVSDNDGPGWRGALKLANTLSVRNVIWVPPTKDMREYVSSGGTRQLVDSLTSSLMWNQPTTKTEGI